MSRSRPLKCPNGRRRCICRDRIGAGRRLRESVNDAIPDGIDEHEAAGPDEGEGCLCSDPDCFVCAMEGR